VGVWQQDAHAVLHFDHHTPLTGMRAGQHTHMVTSLDGASTSQHSTVSSSSSSSSGSGGHESLGGSKYHTDAHWNMADF
jgi:hypothetical protein